MISQEITAELRKIGFPPATQSFSIEQVTTSLGSRSFNYLSSLQLFRLCLSRGFGIIISNYWNFGPVSSSNDRFL
jgi:hypothetical protein